MSYIDENKDKYIDNLTALRAIFKYQLDSEYMTGILSQCIKDAKNIKAFQAAMDEIKERYEGKYNAMNKDYWDGAKYVFTTIYKHMGGFDEFVK